MPVFLRLYLEPATPSREPEHLSPGYLVWASFDFQTSRGLEEGCPGIFCTSSCVYSNLVYFFIRTRPNDHCHRTTETDWRMNSSDAEKRMTAPGASEPVAREATDSIIAGTKRAERAHDLAERSLAYSECSHPL